MEHALGLDRGTALFNLPEVKPVSHHAYVVQFLRKPIPLSTRSAGDSRQSSRGDARSAAKL